MEAIAGWLDNNRRRVLSWFKDDVFRRLFLNAGRLLTANGIATALGLVVTILTARALGPAKYGVLALVLVYQTLIRNLVTFNAWQAIIKFGSEALEADDLQALRQLIKFGFCLDGGSAVVGTILALVLSGLLTALLGWDQAIRPLLLLYSLLILFSLSGTPIGVLRLFDRFDLLSYAAVLNVLIKLAGVIWCLLARWDLYGFVFVYLITGVIGQLYLIIAALYLLHKKGISPFFVQPLHGLRSRFPGIWSYVCTTYLNSSTVMVLRQCSILVIAALTSPATLGLYRIAQQISSALPMLSDPLYQSIYPELTRLAAGRDRQAFFSLVKRTTFLVSTVALCGWLAFVVFGRWFVMSIVGPEYDAAYLVTVVYMLALVIALVGFSLQPSMLALGLPGRSLVAILAGTVSYFCLLVPLLAMMGIVGASLAYIGYYLVWFSIMLLFLRPHFVGDRQDVPTGH